MFIKFHEMVLVNVTVAPVFSAMYNNDCIMSPFKPPGAKHIVWLS